MPHASTDLRTPRYEINLQGTGRSLRFNEIKSFNAELLHEYLYDMGTKFEKFVPPKEIDRRFRETETERVFTIETPTVVLSKTDGIILVRKAAIIKCSTNLWATNYPNLFLSKRDISGLSRMKAE